MKIEITLTDEEIKDAIVKVVAERAGISLDKYNATSETYNRGCVIFTEKKEALENENI